MLHCFANTISSLKMNTKSLKVGLTVMAVYGTLAMGAQEQPASKDIQKNQLLAQEDEAPAMYKFEPNYIESVEKRTAEIKRKRAIIDTLDISEAKRKKLILDLYKNGPTKRLNRVLLADTTFDGVEQ